MNNKDVLNIFYKFINRIITSIELVDELNNIDKQLLLDNKELKVLIDDINVLVDSIPNVEDEYVIKKREQINRLINRFDSMDVKDDFINDKIKDLKSYYGRDIDSHERWKAIFECIIKNGYLNNTFDSMNDYELLEFIAQYIQVPMPPNMDQEEFDRLVKVGIENDKKEWLWRLAFNYENSGLNFDSIVDYFIKVKDGYYLGELISAVGECLDIDNIIDKIQDKELIEDLKTRKAVISCYVSDEQFNRLISKI